MGAWNSRGDRRRAFESEAIPHLSRIHSAALRLARSRADAEDLVQETFLRAYRTFDNFAPGTNSRAWLFTILGSVHANRVRRGFREPELREEEALEAAASRATGALDWEAVFHAAAFAGASGAGEAVERALTTLSGSSRALVLLVDVEGLTYEEAAIVLGCPIGTVRSRLSRARRILARELAAHAASLGYGRKETR
jgi:RNA polymerase sigma-70 factor (ECF subfamily)